MANQWIELAQRVLEENDNEPMTSVEIFAYAEKMDYLGFTKAPNAGAISSEVGCAIRGNRSEHYRGMFVELGSEKAKHYQLTSEYAHGVIYGVLNDVSKCSGADVYRTFGGRCWSKLNGDEWKKFDAETLRELIEKNAIDLI